MNRRAWMGILAGMVVVGWFGLWPAIGATPFDSDRPIEVGGSTRLDGTPGLGYAKTWVGTVQVDTALNIRSRPWGEILGQFKNGAKLQIVGREGDWYKIIWRGRIAYCHAGYVDARAIGATPGPSSSGSSGVQIGTVNVQTSLNIRSSPWGQILGQFKNGDRVKVIGKVGDWYRIKWNGQTVYCHSAYISVGGTSGGTQPPGSTTPAPGAGQDNADLARWKGGRLPPAQFLRLLGPAAQESSRRTGIPASVILAQAALETGWGRATIGDAKNLFGIKGTGPAGSITVPTQEYINGRYVTVQGTFRKYHTWSQSIDDHARVLQLPRYRNAFNYKNNPDQFAREIAKGGYATSPTYANTLISLMRQYNMYQYNV